MSNVYKSVVEETIGTVPSPLYSVPLGSSAFVIGAIFANTTGSNVSLTVTLAKAATSTTSTVIKDAPIPPGSAIQILNGEKIVMEPEDVLSAVSNTPGSISSTVSLLEVR